MFRSLFSRELKTAKQIQQLLEEWEYNTCLGSEYSNQKDYKSAILYFEKALTQATLGLSTNKRQVVFMQYYSLASMNLAHALNQYQKLPQSEKVLSDAHFNMLSMMVDRNQPASFRYQAKAQADVLLQSLKNYLNSMGRASVADSLEEEFYRLTVNSQLN